MTALLDTQRLRQARLAAGFTERGIARQLGTSALRIRRLEAGFGHPQVTLDLLTRLAATLDLNPAELLSYTDRPPSRADLGSAPLRLDEARALYRVYAGDHRLAGRGPHGTAQRHLIATGVLTHTRPDPHRAARVELGPATRDELAC